MSKSELHDWEYAIEKLSGDNADKMIAIAQDIYNTAFARRKNYMSKEENITHARSYFTSQEEVNKVAAELSTDIWNQTQYKCPKCGNSIIENNVVLTSYPSQHAWKCKHCDWTFKGTLSNFMDVLNNDQTAGMRTGGFNGICQTAAQTLFQHKTVNHQFNAVFFILFTGDLFRQIIEDSIHPHAGKAALAGILKDLLMLALFAANDGGEDDKSRTFTQSFHTIHDLIDGLPGNLPAALGTMGNTHPRPQKTQIIVNFRHRSNGGTGILGRGLLVDGNGRGEAVDAVYIRLVHLS